jgi:eukaryotic-like serine/threonine-protein kinase
LAENDSQDRLGELAVQRGMLTAEQLHEALGEFNVRRAAGSRLPLGEVLVELELLTRRQLEILFEAQGGKKAPRQILPGFELIRKLGEGGMGVTYLARQVSMHRLVALKVLRKSLSRSSEFTERFRREARLSGKLNHVNIVQAIDVGEAEGYHYLVMEYVEGKTLKELLPSSGALDEETALHIAMQMARALAYANQSGIVHRDIKPDNILVTADQVAKLCDFGLAKQSEEDSGLTQAGMAMGTPHYISPEQARGETDIDIRGDIYSLGATLYRVATGATPFSGPTAAVVMTKHLSEQLPWPQDVNPDVSDGVSRVIEKMMAKDRASRYSTPEELIADLELVIDGKMPQCGSPGSAHSSLARRGTRPVRSRSGKHGTTRHQQTRLRDPAAEREKRPSRRLAAGSRKKPFPVPLLLGIVALAVLALIGGAYVLMRPPGKTSGSGQLPGPPVIVNTRPGQSDPADAERAGRRALADAEKWWAQHPDEFDAALRRFAQVPRRKTGLLAMQVDHAVRKVKTARAKASEAVLRELRGKAEGLAARGDFDAALKTLGKPPGKFARLLEVELRSSATRLRGKAEGLLRKAIDSAGKLSREGEPLKALTELKQVAGVKYLPLAAELARLRARLDREKLDVARLEEKRSQARAGKLLAPILDRFDKLALAGDYRGAVDHVAAERKKLGKAGAALIASRLDAARRVAKVLEAQVSARSKGLAALVGKTLTLQRKDGTRLKVTVRKVLPAGFEVEREYFMMGQRKTRRHKLLFSELAAGQLEELLPSARLAGADGHIAALLLALKDGESKAALGRAETELKAAGQHPLREHYDRKLRTARLGAAEVAAEDAWERQIQPLVSKEYKPDPAKKLLAATDKYLAEQGSTQFGRGKGPEIERLRALARAGLAPPPPPPPNAQARQTAFTWAADSKPEARKPGQIKWAPPGRALAFEPGKIYLVALQVVMKANCGGGWYLQYQEDYDGAKPGAWTDIANGGVWKTEARHVMSLRNAAEVRTEWYSMPLIAGAKAATGEFCTDNNGLHDNYRAGDCVELWYVIRAEKQAAGHRYRFRLRVGRNVIAHQAYPLAAPAAK